MSWAEAKNIKDTLADKMSDLSNATLRINVGQSYAGRKLMLKRYDKDYMEVTMDSQGTAEVSVQPRSRYELVDTDAANNTTSNVFFVGSGEYKEVKWAMVTEDGAEKTPTDVVASWIECAGVGHLYPYTTVEQVLADAACLRALCNSDNATKYLLRSSGIVKNVIHNPSFLSYMGQSPKSRYLCAMNEAFCEILCNETFYDEAKIIFNARPFITSSSQNTSPILNDAGDRYDFDIPQGMLRGTYGNYFDGVAHNSGNNYTWAANGMGNNTITHTFASKKFIPKIMRWNSANHMNVIVGECKVALSGSNDDTNFEALATKLESNTGGFDWVYNEVYKTYKGYRIIKFNMSGFNYRESGAQHQMIDEIEVYGVWEEDKDGGLNV